MFCETEKAIGNCAGSSSGFATILFLQEDILMQLGYVLRRKDTPPREYTLY